MRGLVDWWRSRRGLLQELAAARSEAAAERTLRAAAELETACHKRVLEAYGEGVAGLVAGFRREAAEDLTRIHALARRPGE